jgi:hypothetical protein
VYYDMPEHLPQNWVIVGDIHSHVDFSAYSSATDQDDEQYRTGLHIVVGRIYNEPPEFHVEATVDGVRFPVQQDKIFEGYDCRRDDFPKKWFDWLTIELTPSSWTNSSSKWNMNSGSVTGSGYGRSACSVQPPARGDSAGYTVAPVDADRGYGNGRKKKGHGRGKRR